MVGHITKMKKTDPPLLFSILKKYLKNKNYTSLNTKNLNGESYDQTEFNKRSLSF